MKAEELKKYDQEKENYKESIRFYRRGNLLNEESPVVGDYEWLSFPKSRIKHQLLGMFRPEIRRTCRITEMSFTPTEDEDELTIRLEKKYE